MKVIEHLIKERSKPLISFEIIPPERGANFENLKNLVDDLSKFNPPFIDVTSHAAEVDFIESKDGYKRVIKRKSPGTLGLCGLIQHKYGIDAVPHVLCYGFTVDETEDLLIDLNFQEIHNVLAIGGDAPKSFHKKQVPDGKIINKYASDLVKQINNMNNGRYIDNDSADPTNFCVGVAAYPEKHYRSPNILKDVEMLKNKFDSGSDYAVTQMFFDNNKYFDFLDLCKSHEIDKPIIPGLKVITRKRHLSTIPETFYCDIPYDLVEEIESAKNTQVLDIGVEHTANQARELLENGAPSIHLYVMNSAEPAKKVIDKLKDLF